MAIIAVLAGPLNAASSDAMLRRRDGLASSGLTSKDYNHLLIVAVVTFDLVLGFRSALNELSDPSSPTLVSGSVPFQLGMNLLLLVLVGVDRLKRSAPQQ